MGRRGILIPLNERNVKVYGYFTALRPVATPESYRVGNPAMRLAVLRANGALDWYRLLNAIGRMVASGWASRLIEGNFRPLTPRYRAWKLRHGMPGTPGVATKQLATELSNCLPRPAEEGE